MIVLLTIFSISSVVIYMCSQKFHSFAHFYLFAPYYILEDRISSRRCRNIELGNHLGEMAIITGGHRGIGAMITRDLLSTGMHVIMGCRKVEDGVKFVNSLREEGLSTGTTTILPLDLSSFQSVKEFAGAVLMQTDKINYLINNAGIVNFVESYKETGDKFETQWQVNYLSHFLLCHLLMPTLESTSTTGIAKIVNVSSVEHSAVLAMDYENLNNEKTFDGQLAYGRSKLAQVMFTLYLNDKLRSVNSNVEVVAAHPGIVDTDIFDSTPLKQYFPFLPRLFFKSPKMGAKPIVYAALYGKGGEYIGNCRPESTSSLSRNIQAQQKLFEWSKASLNIETFGNIC